MAQRETQSKQSKNIRETAMVERRKNGSKIIYAKIDTNVDKTDQSFKEDCDINTIVKRFTKGQAPTHLSKFKGTYADVTEIPDLGDALTQVNVANETFRQLPAELRKRFGNDPKELVAFIQNDTNYEEAIKLGLVPKKASTSKASEEPPAGSKKSKESLLKSDMKGDKKED